MIVFSRCARASKLPELPRMKAAGERVSRWNPCLARILRDFADLPYHLGTAPIALLCGLL